MMMDVARCKKTLKLSGHSTKRQAFGQADLCKKKDTASKARAASRGNRDKIAVK